MFNNLCPTPTPKNSYPDPPPGFRKQDRSSNTYSDQAVLRFSERYKTPQKSRYALAARKILANVRTPPQWQPHPTGLISTINTNLVNIKEWAILDSGASSHFLQVDAPLLHKQKRRTQLQSRWPTDKACEAHMMERWMYRDYPNKQGMHMLFQELNIRYCQSCDYATMDAK